jgi:hypothetical protein
MDEFLLKDGQSPFKRQEGVFLPGCHFFAFTNRYSEIWVAYIHNNTKDIWVSGGDVDWEWVKIENISWVCGSDETDWFQYLLLMRENIMDPQRRILFANQK